jgi:hypothetical protein
MMKTKTVNDSVSYPQKETCPIKSLLEDSAREWNLSQKTIILMLLVPVIIGLIGASTALFGKSAYKMFTGEDKIAENLQVLFWLMALALNIKLIPLIFKSEQKTIAVLYTLLALGMFFLIGEEVSWGQRIFGWETSETLMQLNKQGETNLHNIHGVGTMFKYFHIVIGLYGTILPLIFLNLGGLRKPNSEAISLLVPPFALIPYFLTALLWRMQATFWKPPKSLYFAITEFSEVIELIIAIAFFLFMVYQSRRPKTAEIPA